MSKIINKKQLDLVIESTLKEMGMVPEETCPECGNEVCECDSYMDDEHDDVVESSVKDLAESVTKTLQPDFLTENMENFNKLINYRNK
jgi:hypothetical protein